MTTEAISVVQNLVLDTLQPFLERLEDLSGLVEYLEHQVNRLALGTQENVTAAAQSHEQPSVDRITPDKDLSGLEARVEAVLGLHRLDASPAQWQQDNSGKRVAAPDGLWELSCSGCAYTTMWMDGDPAPRRCKTVEMLTK